LVTGSSGFSVFSSKLFNYGGVFGVVNLANQCCFRVAKSPPTFIRTDIWNWRVLGSCRARDVDCIGVIHGINPIPFNSTLAAFGFVDLEISGFCE